MFLMVVIIIGAGIIIGVLLRSTRNERRDMIAEREKMRTDMAEERERMWAVADKFGSAADKIAEQTSKLVTELEVLRAVSSRVEATGKDGRK